MSGKISEPSGVRKNQAPRPWLRFLAVAALAALCGCLATGTREITEESLIARIQAGQSTKTDVADLMGGMPAAVTFGEHGQETWYYLYTTITPRAVVLVPIARAYTRNLEVETRSFTFTFSREGIVQKLGPGPMLQLSRADPAPSAEPQKPR